jgi:hypothetical protein
LTLVAFPVLFLADFQRQRGQAKDYTEDNPEHEVKMENEDAPGQTQGQMQHGPPVRPFAHGFDPRGAMITHQQQQHQQQQQQLQQPHEPSHVLQVDNLPLNVVAPSHVLALFRLYGRIVNFQVSNSVARDRSAHEFNQQLTFLDVLLCSFV